MFTQSVKLTECRNAFNEEKISLFIKARQRNYRKPAKKFTLIKNKLLKLALARTARRRTVFDYDFFHLFMWKMAFYECLSLSRKKRKIKKKIQSEAKNF